MNLSPMSKKPTVLDIALRSQYVTGNIVFDGGDFKLEYRRVTELSEVRELQVGASAWAERARASITDVSDSYKAQVRVALGELSDPDKVACYMLGNLDVEDGASPEAYALLAKRNWSLFEAIWNTVKNASVATLEGEAIQEIELGKDGSGHQSTDGG